MNKFAYMTARSLASAQAAARDGGRYFAGGIDLLGEMKEFLVSPPIVVNIKSLPDLDEIRRESGRWTIGANVTLTALANDEVLRASLPGLAQAAEEVGSPQIRNVATIGGNLAQHSRCWYYRHRDVKCLKNGGSTCYAREGESRYHAIFSGNPCISPVVSNLAIILAAFDATVLVQRDAKDPVSMSIADLYRKAWENPFAQNSLEPADLILKVEIPEARNRSAYLQVSEKSDFDWALVSCAAAARVENGTLHDARVALGSVSPVPRQSDEVNALLSGKPLTEELAEKAAEELLAGASPRPDNAYKVPIAKTLVKRVLRQLVS